MSEYEVRISKDYLVFPAAHFITYGGKCEPLHGHNYRASVVVTGDLDENHYVFDFVELKRITKEIVDELDHKTLLPRDNPSLEIALDEASVQVRYQEREYRFPRADVVILPVPNTTAEMIATYIAHRLKEALVPYPDAHLNSVTVEVEESFGQSARYRGSLL